MLLERGYGGTSTRAVAEQAGVPLSLVHYHFGDKRSLLVAVLERPERLLLGGSTRCYAEPGPLAEKWRIACEFLDEDVRSGYVRVLWELWAAGLADDALAERWRSTMGRLARPAASVFERWARELDLELPLSPRGARDARRERLSGHRDRAARRRHRGGGAAPRGLDALGR